MMHLMTDWCCLQVKQGIDVENHIHVKNHFTNKIDDVIIIKALLYSLVSDLKLSE